MYFSPARWLMAMFAAMAFSAPAQQTIIFSKPADVSADKANAFLPGPGNRASDYNAPRQLFASPTPDLPLPQPQIQDNNDASVQEALDKRRNWTLLTPEQILGIQTPEEILGVPDKNGDAEKNLSLAEKFLLRESRADAFAATNGRSGADAANPFALKNNDDENDPFRESSQKPEPGTGFFNELSGTKDSDAGPDDKPDSQWTSVFAQPTQPKASPEQLADMERFRALLEPSPPPDKLTVPTRFSVPAVPAADPFLQPAPFVNTAGRDIAPLENEFSRPAGIKPLPGISTPPPKPVAVKPSWQAQLPPWMTDGPQAQNPNRNF